VSTGEIPTEVFLERLWLETFPDADVVRIPEASHFFQEDADVGGRAGAAQQCAW